MSRTRSFGTRLLFVVVATVETRCRRPGARLQPSSWRARSPHSSRDLSPHPMPLQQLAPAHRGTRQASKVREASRRGANRPLHLGVPGRGTVLEQPRSRAPLVFAAARTTDSRDRALRGRPGSTDIRLYATPGGPRRSADVGTVVAAVSLGPLRTDAAGIAFDRTPSYWAHLNARSSSPSPRVGCSRGRPCHRSRG